MSCGPSYCQGCGKVGDPKFMYSCLYAGTSRLDSCPEGNGKCHSQFALAAGRAVFTKCSALSHLIFEKEENKKSYGSMSILLS
eukprot:SAG31_NODE_241_length_19364_cov_17.168544_6_plen_83_part_00